MTDGMDPLDFAALTVAHDESNAYDAVVPHRADFTFHLPKL